MYINQYDINNIYYCDSIKNNVVNDGTFIRIIYSTDYFITNGVNISVPFSDVTIEKYYNKYKCTFNVSNNRNNIESIYNIEKEILDKINTKSKIIQTKISPPILYNIQNNILPDLITISSFSKDKEANTDIDFGAFTYVATNIFVYVPTVEYKYYYPESSIQLFDSSNLIFKQGNNYPSLSSTTKETIFYYKPYFYDTVQTNDINKVITFQVTKLPNI